MNTDQFLDRLALEARLDQAIAGGSLEDAAQSRLDAAHSTMSQPEFFEFLDAAGGNQVAVDAIVEKASAPFFMLGKEEHETLSDFVFRVWHVVNPEVTRESMPHDQAFMRTIVPEGYGHGYNFARTLREMLPECQPCYAPDIFAGYSNLTHDGLTRTTYYAFNSREDGEINRAAFYDPSKARTFGNPHTATANS